MAIMYPETPKECSPESHEEDVFYALSKLSNDYYVFHSLTLLRRNNGKLEEHEADFIVFNQKKGLLCIECKAGQIRYSEGAWRHGNGKPMAHDGPFNQASKFKHNLRKYIEESGFSKIVRKCKMMHAVCFPTVLKERFGSQPLPPDADYELIIFKESLDNITKTIESIFDIPVNANVETSLTDEDTRVLFNNIIAPKFNLLPIASIEDNHRNYIFKSMLSEQISLLGYLEEQRIAVINGAAGTGKTLMALEKAKRHAAKGEKVLFLCYNSKLKDYLLNNYADPGIDYYTIDGLAYKLCSQNDYSLLQDKLFEYTDGSFPYMHIIIDEGQDFGQDAIEDSDILQLLYELIYEREDEKGSFYIFYDRNQLIQGRQLPSWITDADCKLTLYRNCRNTENIAVSSMRFINNEKKPKLFEKCISGNSPVMFFEENAEQQIKSVNYMIDAFYEKYNGNIVLLTCSTVEKSILSEFSDNGFYRYNGKKIMLTTCRKFKGLEADAIIIVDVKEGNFYDETARNILYVGSSRARFELAIITNLTKDAICCQLDVLEKRHTKNPAKALATAYNAKYISISEDN